MDNHILCNIPRVRSCSSTSSKQKNRGNNNNSSSSRMLEISKVDFAGFGLFKEAIPTLLQAILCEHRPCSSADSVIPSAPPVVQSRDGIVINAASPPSNTNKIGISIFQPSTTTQSKDNGYRGC